ncbi:hypothetical protein [Blattabacterium cuenoti]|uniref:hypothetical protein n=1 Tax=Blattabacterium cuenoti TaxID=1653831 RepID=UPI00163D0DC6|nr:hypothetical protein [Blattabacterium cuenoti]
MNNFFEKKIFTEKYHPKELEEIIGQNKIIFNLKKIIKNNKCIPNFLFFFGKSGVGKNVCANILAKKLNNKFSILENNIKLIEFYNELENSYDIEKTLKKFLFHNNINVFVINKLNSIPSRFFIITEIITKIVIKNILFIICDENKKNIPNYILKYSYIFNFKKISVKDIFFHIKMISEKENIKIDKEALLIISQYADGSIGNAITLFNKIITDNNKKIITKNLVINELKLIDTKFYFKLIDYLLDNKIHDILIMIKNIFYQKNKNPHDFINGLKKYIKNLLLYKKNNKIFMIGNYNKYLINYYEIQSKNISFFILNKILNMCFNIEHILYSYHYNDNIINSIIETNIISLSTFFSLYKEKKVDKNILNKEFFIIQNNINFISEYWKKFITDNYKNTTIIDKFINKTKIEISNNKIIIIIPNIDIENNNLSLINENFIKFFEKKIYNIISNIKIINRKKLDENETKKNKYKILYKKNKFIDSLIKRLNLKNIH